ncbi:hypothetical protein [Singulisphaera sp. GP187]|uniref:hypothetical protein n=1 Tax=Singulisphaera sp. GP187 TaxID=1882752 RepID=UPI0011614BB2|nr:hypothetical protein [Singulisphaera sp. GP187]
MRIPRLTTQRMMIGVAILALGLAVERPINRLARISGLRRHTASLHATAEQWFRKASGVTSKSAAQTTAYGGVHLLEPEAERQRRAAWQLKMAEYHGELSRKYELAAWYPWAKLAPNPPQPE